MSSIRSSSCLSSAALTASLCRCSFLACPAVAVAASIWSEVASPSSGVPQVIGGASRGCVAGALALPESGPGYVSVRRYRHRYFGHPDLLRLISELGRTVGRLDQGLLMVGDLSQPRGGLMSSSHRSHQNGLDADIWFTLAPSPQAARLLVDNREDPPSMVQPGGGGMSAAWGVPQQRLLEAVARHPWVDRLFVNPSIKRAVCDSARGDRSWLRKVRPWWGHDAHLHVRLRCPADSAQCEAQGALPAGDGCGADLAWWFSAEATRPDKKAPKRAPVEDAVPPVACKAVLKAP